MAALGDEVLGREEELVALRSFLVADDGSPGALIIEGEAGIGKTTLWLEGVRVGRECFHRVLASRPAGSETDLAYSALRDLLDDVFEDVADQLPAPQRQALAVALLLENVEGPPPGQGAVAAGFLGVVRALARAGPVLVAVDDVQWLDAPSAAVLRFAARRLNSEPVALLLALRLEGEELVPLGLARALPEPRLRILRVGPLSLGALHGLLRRGLGRTFPRPLLRRLHTTAGGNPFFALELARALERGGVEPEPGAPLPLPSSLRELLRERLQVLPPMVAKVLLAASALSNPTVSLLEKASPSGKVAARLEAAAEAGIVLVDGDRVRFVHPLLASAVYSAAALADRHELHRRLGGIVADPEERARHLALAAQGPDAAIALALHEAARGARARGAPAAAAELAEQALRLTPPEDRDDVHRRRLEGARHHFDAGDSARGRLLLEEAVANAPPGPQRAEARTRLARAHVFEADNRSAARLYREALAEADAGSGTRAEAEGGIAVALMRMLEDLPAAARHARTAGELAERRGDARGAAELLGALALIESLLGRPDALTLMERAGRLDESTQAASDPSSRFLEGLGPRFMRAVLLTWTDGVDEARSLLATAYDRAVELGDEGSLPLLLRYMSYGEWLAGNWAEAARRADEGDEAAVQTGQPSQRAVLLGCRALLEAHLGRIEPARDGAREALALAGETGAMFGTTLALSALGLLELSLGNPAATDEYLRPLVEHLEAAGVQQPGVARFVPDEIEALIALDRLEEAEELLDRHEQRATRLEHGSGLAACWRCRGVLRAARVDFPAALSLLERALGQHDSVAVPFDRARTLLALGQVHRRAKRKRAARTALEAALAGFSNLGAEIWTEKARTELARIGGRPAASGELTPTEERVAALAAQGLSSKEMAAELFVSVKTVEGHLSRIYAKLGVRSRAELASRFAGRAVSASDS